MSSGKKRAIKALLVLGAIFLLAALSELIPRFFSPRHGSEGKNFYRTGAAPGLAYEHVPGVRGTLDGVSVRINALGFRGPELEVEKRDLTRVVIPGDSVVFGHGLAEEGTLAVQLAGLLEQAAPGRRWQVINAGVRGYGARHYVPYFKDRILPLQPDLLILVITMINDPEQKDFLPRSERLIELRGSFWAKVPLAKLFVARAALHEINRLFEEHVRAIYDPEGPDWPLFIEELRTIRGLGEQNRIPLIAVAFPLLEDEDKFRAEREQLK